MKQFTEVPAKITARGLETQEIDQKRGQLIEDHKKRSEDQKHFIRSNMKGVRQAQMECKTNQMSLEAAATKKRNFETKYNTKIPTYLQRFRREEEEERQRTLAEIASNKRPPGTRVVTAGEKQKMIDELHGRQKFCQDGIKNMSVT